MTQRLKKDGTPDKRVKPTAVGATTRRPALKKVAVKVAPKVTPEEPTSAPAAPKAGDVRTITFLGRNLDVRMPDGEQLLAWESILGKIAKMNESNATLETIKRPFGQLYTVINAVLAKDEDREWVEDGRLSGEIKVESAVNIVIDAIAAFGQGVAPNRAARRSRK